MSAKWSPSGKNWMWATWVGSTHVIYLVRKSERDETIWNVERKVPEAANSGPHFVGTRNHLAKALKLAEDDAEDLNTRGF